MMIAAPNPGLSAVERLNIPAVFRSRVIAVGAVLVIALATAAAADKPMAQSDVEQALTCQCGCGLTVHNCNHLQCGFGVPVKDDIASSLTKGESGQSIIARYQSEYGEKILSAPTTTGFNLLAWTIPYVAVLAGGLGLLLAFRRIGRRPIVAVESVSMAADPLAARKSARRRLQQELEDMDT